MDSWRICGVW